MDINLGLAEADMQKARRREFPAILRNLVEDGAKKIEIILEAETAMALAEDVEFAIENRVLR